MIQIIEKVNSMVNNFIWGVPAMVCIFGVGLYLEHPDRIFADPENFRMRSGQQSDGFSANGMLRMVR